MRLYRCVIYWDIDHNCCYFLVFIIRGLGVLSVRGKGFWPLLQYQPPRSKPPPWRPRARAAQAAPELRKRLEPGQASLAGLGYLQLAS